MFDNITPREPEDMFAGTESPAPVPTPAPTSAPTPARVPTSVPTAPPPGATATAPVSAMSAPAVASSSRMSKGKVGLFIGGVVVIVAVAGFLSSYVLSSRTPVVPDIVTQTPQAQEEAETSPAVSQPVVEEEPVASVDTDKDGLTDEEEETLGTSVRSSDTDRDGLYDYEEIRVYHTDPLAVDSDGDSYEDGAEVDAGYNPNGSGKLLTLPSEE